MNRVEVRWLDANRHVYDDWTRRDALRPSDTLLATVHTCGYLVYQGADRIVVALQWDKSSDSVGDGMVIPRAVVQSITLLREDTTELA